MRVARAILGATLVAIGILAIADQGAGGGVWWLVAALATAAGLAGILSAARPEERIDA